MTDPDRSAAEALPAPFFVLRTPLLPVDVLLQCCELTPLGAGTLDPEGAEGDRLDKLLRTLLRLPELKEALFVASPRFEAAVDAWLRSPQTAAGRRTRRSIGQHLGFLCAGVTEPGLASGFSVGLTGDRTALAVPPRSACRRQVTLDASLIRRLAEDAARTEEALAKARYFPNPFLHRAGASLRYLEFSQAESSGAPVLDSVEVKQSPHLEAAVSRARQGATLAELEAAVREADPRVGREGASGYVRSLVESQVLVSDVLPSATEEDPLGRLCAASDGAGNEAAARLSAIRASLEELDGGRLGVDRSAYGKLVDLVREARPEVSDEDLSAVLRVELSKPAEGLTLGPLPLSEIRAAVDLLCRVGASAKSEPLSRFRRDFAERYGEQEVPLLEALDPDRGLGFAGERFELTAAAPLVEGLPDPEAEPEGEPFTPRAARLLRRVSEVLRRGAVEWELSDDDVAWLSGGEARALPDAFSVACALGAASSEAIDRGEFRVFVRGVLGGPACAPLGHLCRHDPRLRDLVREQNLREEAADPTRVHAEIASWPSGVEATAGLRPPLREREIPLVGGSSLPQREQIPLADLRVSVRGDQVRLYSTRLDREIVPRLTAPYDASSSALAVERFLAALEEPSRLAWGWGPLEASAFLPRVRKGRVVLAPARWTIDTGALASLQDDDESRALAAFEALRTRLGLPRWVRVGGGRGMLVDTGSTFSVASMLPLLEGLSSLALEEAFPDADWADAAAGPEGRFLHEFLVPFAMPEGRAAARPPSRMWAHRAFLPGSSRLSLRLFASENEGDALLLGEIAPLLEEAHARGVRGVEGWRFEREHLPDFHLHVLLRGEPGRLAELLPVWQAGLSEAAESGLLRRLVADTHRETPERFGGPAGLALAEAFFEADSRAALELARALSDEGDPHARWRVALRGVHDILEVLVPASERVAVVSSWLEPLRSEFLQGPSPLPARFRRQRSAIEALLASRTGEELGMEEPFGILARRAEALRAIAERARSAAEAGTLDCELSHLARVFAESHVNRLVRAQPRKHAYALFEFLLRAYEKTTQKPR